MEKRPLKLISWFLSQSTLHADHSVFSVAGIVQDVKDFQFFSSAGSSGILPLTILPEEVVDMVLKEGKTPHGGLNMLCNRHTAAVL